LREIACPPDCVHLLAAQAHPPAVVQRQRQRDKAFLLQLLDGLSTSQRSLLSALHGDLRAYGRTAMPPPADADLAEAAAVLAESAETAGRGILYERPAASGAAPGLVRLCRERIDQREAEQHLSHPAVAQVLRALETAARTAAVAVGGEGGEAAFFAFLERTAAGPAGPNPPGAGEAQGRASPRIILP
jgi:hypothetical protein